MDVAFLNYGSEARKSKMSGKLGRQIQRIIKVRFHEAIALEFQPHTLPGPDCFLWQRDKTEKAGWGRDTRDGERSAFDGNSRFYILQNFDCLTECPNLRGDVN